MSGNDIRTVERLQEQFFLTQFLFQRKCMHDRNNYRQQKSMHGEVEMTEHE